MKYAMPTFKLLRAFGNSRFGSLRKTAVMLLFSGKARLYP
jgi:hypothetical protein